jgi:hypothetical protein
VLALLPGCSEAVECRVLAIELARAVSTVLSTYYYLWEYSSCSAACLPIQLRTSRPRSSFAPCAKFLSTVALEEAKFFVIFFGNSKIELQRHLLVSVRLHLQFQIVCGDWFKKFSTRKQNVSKKTAFDDQVRRMQQEPNWSRTIKEKG